jgi:hypothetical protein
VESRKAKAESLKLNAADDDDYKDGGSGNAKS